MACRIQAKLDIKNIPAFDVTAACSGLIYTLNMAKAYINSGMYKNVLIIAVTTIHDYAIGMTEAFYPFW